MSNGLAEFDPPPYQWQNNVVHEEPEEEEEVAEEEEEENTNVGNRNGGVPQYTPPQVTGGNIARRGGGRSISVDPTLIETLLLLLIVVNGFTSHQFTGLWGTITGKGSGTNTSGIRQGFIVLFGEMIFLVIMSLIARSSPVANKVVLTLVVVMWLVWFFHNRPSIDTFASKVIPNPPKPVTNNPPGGSTTK